MSPEIWFPHIGIKIEHLNSVAFNLFGIPILFYGIFIMLGVVAGLLWALYEAKRTEQNPELYLDFLICVLIPSIIGARIYYVIFEWESYGGDFLKMINIREGGLAIHGAVIAAGITAIIYTKIKKLNFGFFADTCAPGLILGQIIGRYGNFFNREAFGGYTDNFLAMRYRADTVAIPSSQLDTLIDVNGISYLQVHPTFLYESVWNLGVFFVMFFYRKNKKFNGEVFVIYLLGYALGRVWIEGLRTDQLQIGSTGIAVSQVLAGAIIVVTICFLIWKRISISRNKQA